MKRAFTLVEMLMVIAIIALLIALIVPAVSSIGRGEALSTATATVTGSLELARQTAVSQNRTMEVRFYKLPIDGQSPSAPEYCAIQTFLVDYDGTTAFNKMSKFPAPVAITSVVPSDDTTLYLMDSSANTKTPEQTPTAGMNLPNVGLTYKYRSIRFKSDGTLDLPFSKQLAFTLVNKGEAIKANNLPANYATIRIDPISGRASVKRP